MFDKLTMIVSPALTDFLSDNRWGFDKVFAPNTELYKDLNLYGDDAVEFILSFSKEFNVDVKEFDFNRHFPPEGDFVLPAIIRLLQFKSQPMYVPIKLIHLDKAIEIGRLNNELITMVNGLNN